MNAGVGSVTSFSEHTSLFRTLTGLFSSGSNIAAHNSLFRSFGGSWSTSASYARGTGFVEKLVISFGSVEFLSGHSGCVNCESVTGYFAFLVIAFGALAFGVYAAKQRRQSARFPEEPEEEKVLVDKEGWETRLSDGDEQRINSANKNEDAQSNPSEEPVSRNQDGNSEGWETKPES